jgi:hypothetical protein
LSAVENAGLPVICSATLLLLLFNNSGIGRQRMPTLFSGLSNAKGIVRNHRRITAGRQARYTTSQLA